MLDLAKHIEEHGLEGAYLNDSRARDLDSLNSANHSINIKRIDNALRAPEFIQTIGKSSINLQLVPGG